MTEFPPKHQANLPSLGEESARDYASRYAQLSVRGKQALDRILVLLSSHLASQPASRISFSPAFLFSVCDALQRGRANSPALQEDTSILPSVLSKLRHWRLLDTRHRESCECIHKLALDLAEITCADEVSASTSSDVGHATSHGRRRIKWVGSDPPYESQDGEPSRSSSPSSSSSRSRALDSAQECAHVLPDLIQCRSDAGYEFCQASRLGTPDSEDAGPVAPRRHRSASEFRSGCSACRHPRVSGPSTPPSPRMTPMEQRMPFGAVNQFDTSVDISVSSPRHPKTSVHSTTSKKTRQGNHRSSQSLSRGAHVDENEPPPPKRPGVPQGIGISFPRQRTHSPRISNVSLSREPYSPVATSVQRRVQASKLPIRTREGDKQTSSHPVASVDSLLPIVHHSRSLTIASPIDFHPHTPNRAQSLSYTPVRSHGFGSVAGRVPKPSSSAVGRSAERLPSWSQTHRRDPQTTPSLIPRPPASSSPTPAKARSQNAPPCASPAAPSQPWMSPNVPSGVTPRDRRSVSAQTHKHTHSDGSLLSSPLLATRRWQL